MDKTLIMLTTLLIATPTIFATHTPTGSPRTYCESPGDSSHEYDSSAGMGILPISTSPAAVDGNKDDCDGNGVPNDPDGHREFMYGGAILQSTLPTACPTTLWAEHASYPIVYVTDYVLASVTFTIAVDSVGGSCGDGIFDVTVTCTSSPCSAPFPPGLDGTYHVLVDGETGIIDTN